MNAKVLAYKKVVLINTALVESHTGLNHFIREIVCKYVTNSVTSDNYDAYMNMAHERPNELIESACIWWRFNIGRDYCDISVIEHYTHRFAINPHTIYN